MLSDYINSLQASGRYTFTRIEVLTTLKCSYDAFRFAALRLTKKKRLIRPVAGFYVIVPTEYQEVGAPPADWFIDGLMKFYAQSYYVGLLSAAALYGAAHQQPQVFQIVTSTTQRAIRVGRSRIQFFTKKKIKFDSYQAIKTPTGYMQVSIPEITAFDLVRHAKSVGHLSHVATVLTELEEQFETQNLSHILESECIEGPTVQRLGYLLETVEANQGTVELFKQWIQKKKPRVIPLRTDKAYEKVQKNMDWHLYINEKIETDI